MCFNCRFFIGIIIHLLPSLGSLITPLRLFTKVDLTGKNLSTWKETILVNLLPGDVPVVFKRFLGKEIQGHGILACGSEPCYFLNRFIGNIIETFLLYSM